MGLGSSTSTSSRTQERCWQLTSKDNTVVYLKTDRKWFLLDFRPRQSGMWLLTSYTFRVPWIKECIFSHIYEEYVDRITKGCQEWDSEWFWVYSFVSVSPHSVNWFSVVTFPCLKDTKEEVLFVRTDITKTNWSLRVCHQGPGRRSFSGSLNYLHFSVTYSEWLSLWDPLHRVFINKLVRTVH